MFFVYVLRNSSTGRNYTGFTSNLTQRIGQHNAGITKSTKNRGFWELVYQEEYSTRAEAMRRERQLKSGQGREELSRILTEVASGGSAG
jgi:putative endonuclease